MARRDAGALFVTPAAGEVERALTEGLIEMTEN